MARSNRRRKDRPRTAALGAETPRQARSDGHHGQAQAPPTEVGAAVSRWPSAIVVFAFSLALFTLIGAEQVRLLLDPSFDVSRIIFLIATVVVGSGGATLLTLAIHDISLRHDDPTRSLSPAFLQRALGVTAVTTLWALMVALLSADGSSYGDIFTYLGNATLLGLLLGTVVLLPVWLIATWRATKALLETADRRPFIMTFIGVGLYGAAVLIAALRVLA